MVNIKLYSFTFIPQKMIFSYLLLIQVIFTADEVFLYGSYEKKNQRERNLNFLCVCVYKYMVYVYAVHMWR